MREKFIKQINQFLTDIFNNIIAFEQRTLAESKSELTISDIHTIEQIGLGGKKKMTDIAEAMGITLAAMTSAADRLEKKGCIMRERSDSDRRMVFLSLTRYGRVVYKLHERFHKRMVEKVIKDFSEDELVILSKALSGLNEFSKTIKMNVTKHSRGEYTVRKVMPITDFTVHAGLLRFVCESAVLFKKNLNKSIQALLWQHWYRILAAL
jgi:DNA-binding MarR family transcriptional regulator